MVRNVLLLCIIILSLNNCHPPTGLEQAEKWMDTVPDSALSILESIDAARFFRRNYYHYVVLKVRAKDKTNLSICNDTLVFEARDYFTVKSDKALAALSSFVCGRSARNVATR